MGPGCHLCHFDNALQDGDGVEVAEAAHSHHYPTPNAGPRHPPVFAISNPAMEEEETLACLPQIHLAAINTQA